MKERIEEALSKIRPVLQRDGGDVELADVSEDGKNVKVRFRGACYGCPAAQMTLKMHIERVVRQEVPEVETVEAVPFAPPA